MNVNEIHEREVARDITAGDLEISAKTASESIDADPSSENPASANPSLEAGAVDPKKKRSWKKPKDKPMRPLSAYNMFFQNQRERIVAGKTGDPTPEEIQTSVVKMLTSKVRGPKRRQDRISHGQISFGDLARTIAAKWKTIDPKLKAIYNHYAGQEKLRYKKEVVIWKEKKEREHDAARTANQNSLTTSSSTYNDSLVSMSSSMTSMSTSMASSYNLSESIDSLRGGMSMQMNDDVVQRQQDILRQQMGFIDSKPHARVGGGHNDVPREIPKLNLAGGGGDDQEFSPLPVGVDGDAGSLNMMGSNNSNNMNPVDDLNGSGSFLDSSVQQKMQTERQILKKENLLLELQKRQLQHLQRLQKARIETSRLSNVKTTDAVTSFMNNAQASRMDGNSNREYPPPSLTMQPRLNPSNANHMIRNQFNKDSHKILRDQFKKLEDITLELDRLKEQERQMQEKINEHIQSTSAKMWLDNNDNDNDNNNNDGIENTFNVSPTVTTSGISTEYNNSLNDTGNNFSSSDGDSSLRSIFDQEIDDKQFIPVRRSRSNDSNVQWQSSGSDAMSAARNERSKLRLTRRHSMYGPGSIYSGHHNPSFSSLPDSFDSGRRNSDGMYQGSNGMHQRCQNQRQQTSQAGRRDSIAALLKLEEMDYMEGINVGERRHQRDNRLQEQMMHLQQQQQQPSPSLLQSLQEGSGGGHHYMGSIFNTELYE